MVVEAFDLLQSKIVKKVQKLKLMFHGIDSGLPETFTFAGGRLLEKLF